MIMILRLHIKCLLHLNDDRRVWNKRNALNPTGWLIYRAKMRINDVANYLRDVSMLCNVRCEEHENDEKERQKEEEK